MKALPTVDDSSQRDLIDYISPTRNVSFNFRSLRTLEDLRDTIELRFFPAAQSNKALEDYILLGLEFISTSPRVNDIVY